MDPDGHPTEGRGHAPRQLLTPEEIERAERESRELQAIWNRMESAGHDPQSMPRDPMRSLFLWGAAATCTLLAALLLTGSSGAPGALTSGGIILIGCLWLLSNPDWRSPALTGLISMLMLAGATSLIYGLMVPRGETEVPEMVELYNENRADTASAVVEFQEALRSIAISQMDSAAIERELQRPIARPQMPVGPNVNPGTPGPAATAPGNPKN